MSALIGLKTGDGAILFTDRAVYDRRYVVCEFKKKVCAAKTVPLAVATRGSEIWSERVSEFIVDLADDIGVDAAIASFGEAAPDLCAFDPDLRNHLEVVIGCLSPTSGPQLLIYRNVALRQIDDALPLAQMIQNHGGEWQLTRAKRRARAEMRQQFAHDHPPVA